MKRIKEAVAQLATAMGEINTALEGGDDDPVQLDCALGELEQAVGQVRKELAAMTGERHDTGV